VPDSSTQLLGAVTGKGGFGSRVGYADVSFVLCICYCIYLLLGRRERGGVLGVVVFGVGVGLYLVLFSVRESWSMAVLVQQVGSDGWRQRPAHGAIPPKMDLDSG